MSRTDHSIYITARRQETSIYLRRRELQHPTKQWASGASGGRSCAFSYGASILTSWAAGDDVNKNGLDADAELIQQIPKPNQTEGLGIGWPATKPEMDTLKALYAELKAKM